MTMFDDIRLDVSLGSAGWRVEDGEEVPFFTVLAHRQHHIRKNGMQTVSESLKKVLHEALDKTIEEINRSL
jgi:hypothetical protein